MAGPGGREVGRLAVKVVPDSDGFRADMEKLLKEYSKRKIEIKVELKGLKKARRELEQLEKDHREVNVDVVLKGLKKAQAQMKALARERTANVNVKAQTAPAEAEVSKVTRNREADIKASADTGKAEADMAAVSRDRTTTVRTRFTGMEAVRQAERLTKDRVQNIEMNLLDKNARTQLKVFDKDAKVIADLEVERDNFRRIEQWLRGLGPEFQKHGDNLAAGFQRAGLERFRRSLSKISSDYSKAAEASNDRLRRSLFRISEDYNKAAAAAETARLRDYARRVKAAQKQRAAEQARYDKSRANALRMLNQRIARQGQQAARQIEQGYKRVQRAQEQAARAEQVRRNQIYREAARRAQQQLRQMGSDFPDRVSIDVAIDPRRRMAAFRAEVRRLQRERIRLQADLSGENGVQARLAALARDRRVRIRAVMDRNNLRSVTGVISNAFRGMAGAAMGSLSGLFRGLSVISSGLGNIGNIGQKVFGKLADSTGKAAGQMGQVAQMSAQTVAAIVSFGAVLAVISAIVAAIGALIVAAIGAVAVLASVVVGAVALLALPAIFAGVTAALVMMGDENNKVKKQFTDLGKTIRDTITGTAAPMIDFFSDSLEKLNKALQKGTPLYKELETGFSESAKALTPLRSGLKDFATNSLGGVNTALRNLNQGKTMESFGTSIGNLGGAIGNFAAQLSVHSPSIANGFDALVSGLDEIGQSLADWMGQFSRFSPATLESFSRAFSRIFDVFGDNADTYTRSATALGNALHYAAPGFENITAAMAKMSPRIFDSLAAGIARLGSVLSESDVQEGLAQLTVMIIDFSAQALAAAAKISGKLGNAFKTFGDRMDIFAGNLHNKTRVTKEMFHDLIKSEGTTREKLNKGLQQLSHSLGRHAADWGPKLQKYAERAVHNMQVVEGKTGAHVQKLAGTLQTLANEWDAAGGKVGQKWYDSWKEASDAVDKSGNEMLISHKNNMQELLDESEAYRNRQRKALEEAFKMDGVKITPEAKAKIEEALGIISETAGTKSQEAIQNIQRNFALLPGIVKTAMDEAKTPEQLRSKLEAVQKVMEHMTPEIAKSFGKLPEDMQKTLADSTAAFESWTGMETFRQKVVTAVDEIVGSFDKLGPAIGTMNGPMTDLSVSFTGTAMNAHIFNNRVHWTSYILGRIGSQASTANSMIGTFGDRASDAANAAHELNNRANGLQSALVNASASALVAAGYLNTLSQTASTAGAGMTTFAVTLSISMALANTVVTSGVDAIAKSLSALPRRAAPHGKLSAFTGSLQASMFRAVFTVTSAVSTMLASLQSLNTTVTATVNINRNETTRRRTIVEPPREARNEPFSAFEPGARGADAAMVSAGRLVSAWRPKASDVKASTPIGPATKNYTFNNTIVGPEPTEKKLVKQLRFTDALYGE